MGPKTQARASSNASPAARGAASPTPTAGGAAGGASPTVAPAVGAAGAAGSPRKPAQAGAPGSTSAAPASPALAACRRKLRVLAYPSADTFSWDVRGEVVKMVAFLEDKKIRKYPISGRVALRQDGPEWPAAVQKYLLDLDCRLPAHLVEVDSAAGIQTVCCWLIDQAVSLEFQDRGSEANRAAAALARTETTASDAKFSGLSHDDCKVLELLAEAVHVPFDMADQIGTIRAVRRAVQLQIKPALSARGDMDSRVDFARDFPSGMEHEDPVFQRVVSVLRMLYIADMRELQDRINLMLTTVQAETQNPVTDSSLGEVGR